LNITGATVFVPTEISEAAWRLIMDDLAIGPDYADSMNQQEGRSEGGARLCHDGHGVCPSRIARQKYV
jgi:hypothetical protein